MEELESLLKGGDLRSTGQSNRVASIIQDQEGFDLLFSCLFHSDRLVVMRAADSIEKITRKNPEYLLKHSKAVFGLSEDAQNKELKWHLASLLTRLHLNKYEKQRAWKLLKAWALNKKESKIVRVNSIQSLFNLAKTDPALSKEFNILIPELENDPAPSVRARIRKLKSA